MINIGKFIEVTIIQLVALFLLCVGILYLIKQYRLNKYEVRLASFSLFTNIEKNSSFFDNLYVNLGKIIKKFASFLEKEKVLPKYVKIFDKYISFENKNKINHYYFLAIKFIISFVLGFLCLITMSLQYTKFNFLLLIFMLLFGFFIPDFVLVLIFNKRRKDIESDLLKAIIIMNNSFKAGNNIGQAMNVVISELKGPISDEFRRIEVDVNHGLSLDVAFARFYDRVKIDDVKYITSSLCLLNITGGNIVNVFNLIEKTFFDKAKLNNELKSLTSSSSFIFKILLLLPFAFIIFMLCLNRSYFTPFFKSQLGMICMVAISLLYIIYVFLVRKVMKVKI